MDKSQIAETLRRLRGSRTQEEVAEAVGISRSSLALYETGQRVPRDAIKVRLAEYYKEERDSYREQLEAMKREASND